MNVAVGVAVAVAMTVAVVVAAGFIDFGATIHKCQGLSGLLFPTNKKVFF